MKLKRIIQHVKENKMHRWLIYTNLIIPIFFEFFLEWQRIHIPTDSYRSLAIRIYWLYFPISIVILNLLLFSFKIEISFFRYFVFISLGLLLGLLIGCIRWVISSQTLIYSDIVTLKGVAKLLIYYFILAISFIFFVKGCLFLSRLWLKK